MSAGTTAALTEVSCALPQSLQVNTGLVPKVRLQSVSSLNFLNSLFATTGLYISPVAGLPADYVLYGGISYFQHKYCCFSPYIQKCVFSSHAPSRKRHIRMRFTGRPTTVNPEMKVASYYTSWGHNFEVAPKFLEHLCTPVLLFYHSTPCNPSY